MTDKIGRRELLRGIAAVVAAPDAVAGAAVKAATANLSAPVAASGAVEAVSTLSPAAIASLATLGQLIEAEDRSEALTDTVLKNVGFERVRDARYVDGRMTVCYPGKINMQTATEMLRKALPELLDRTIAEGNQTYALGKDFNANETGRQEVEKDMFRIANLPHVEEKMREMREHEYGIFTDDMRKHFEAFTASLETEIQSLQGKYKCESMKALNDLSGHYSHLGGLRHSGAVKSPDENKLAILSEVSARGRYLIAHIAGLSDNIYKFGPFENEALAQLEDAAALRLFGTLGPVRIKGSNFNNTYNYDHTYFLGGGEAYHKPQDLRFKSPSPNLFESAILPDKAKQVAAHLRRVKTMVLDALIDTELMAKLYGYDSNIPHRGEEFHQRVPVIPGLIDTDSYLLAMCDKLGVALPDKYKEAVILRTKEYGEALTDPGDRRVLQVEREKIRSIVQDFAGDAPKEPVALKAFLERALASYLGKYLAETEMPPVRTTQATEKLAEVAAPVADIPPTPTLLMQQAIVPDTIIRMSVPKKPGAEVLAERRRDTPWVERGGENKTTLEGLGRR